MRTATLVVPGRLSTRTGGYIYDERVVAGLRARGWTIDVCELEGAFPPASERELQAVSVAFRAIPSGSIVLVDELVFSTIPDVVERETARLRLVPIIHLPLAENLGLEPATAARLEAMERRALGAAHAIVATAPSSVRTLREYGIPAESIVLAEPGTDLMPVARGSQTAVLNLLCAATIEPRKGHDLLVRSLAAVPTEQWHLTCAGSLTRHPEAVTTLREQIRALGLDHRVTLSGELDADAMADCYRSADLFVLATWKETFGMAVAEAIAYGLPVVSTTTGSIPELVGPHAGILVAPGDETALTHALARVLTDGTIRRKLAAGALTARARLPRWPATIDRIAHVLEQLHE
jgi:glycosyltransferase involved in cell wall biosynthesis